jgi:hypothetical protein
MSVVWALRKPCLWPSSSAFFQSRRAARSAQHACGLIAAEAIERFCVTFDHVQHRFAVSLELGERPERGCELGGAAIGHTGHQGGDRCGPGASFV